jgi:FkbM family methyltransferase
MNLDVSDRLDRTAYFLGRFYDLPTQLLMRETVYPGDVFVDVGANIGMLTLLASRLVTPEGRVIAFEPNADVFRRLYDHVQRNRLDNVSLNAFGLGDADAGGTLKVWNNSKGWGTFGTLSPQEQQLLTAEYECRIAKGDDTLVLPAERPVTIKIDVEGFECHVLRGLRNILSQHRPAVIVEVLEDNLKRAASTSEELFAYMFTQGYRAFAIDANRSFLRYRLCLNPISTISDAAAPNVLFAHPESVHFKRLLGLPVQRS